MKRIFTRLLLLHLVFLKLVGPVFGQPAKLEEIKQEFSSHANAVEINIQRSIQVEIIPWDGNMLKVVYRYDISARQNLAIQSLQQSGIEISQSADREIIHVNAVNDTVADSSRYIVKNGKTYYKVNPNKPTLPMDLFGNVDVVFFYIPRKNKLILKLHRHAKVTIREDLLEAEISTTGNGGCTLTAKSIGKLYFNGSYPQATFDSIERGTFKVTGGHLLIRKANILSWQSRYASAKIGVANEITLLSSQSDQFTVDELKSLRGSQEHGLFIIGILKKEIDVAGTGGISISTISSEAISIKIKSDGEVLNLPVKQLKNYAVQINAPRGILLLTEQVRKGIVEVDSAEENSLARFLEPDKAKLHSNVGNVKGKHTLFDITCAGCTINFRTQGDE